MDLMDAEVVNEMLGTMPGAVEVSQGGRTGWGTKRRGVDAFSGVATAEHSLTIASNYFPDLYLDEAEGRVGGVGERVTVGDDEWYVSDIELGNAPGQLRCTLSNRRNP